METDYVKAQLPGVKGEDRIIAVHRAWPADDGNGVSMVGLAHESPTSNFLQMSEAFTTDASFARDDLPEYYLFAVFDGHNGDAAAAFAQAALVPVLEAYLPVPEMAEGMDGAAAWAGAVQEAMVKTVLELDQRFAARGLSGGTTATLALQIGQLLTVVSVGHSAAVLDTGAGLVALTRDHVVGTDASEQERLAAAGCVLATMDASGRGPAATRQRGVGALRVWPGGLTLSRSLGDFSSGPHLLCMPHVVALLLPPGGARLVLGSAPFWRAGGEQAVLDARGAAPRSTAHRLLRAVAGRARGDVSVIVADTAPRGEGFSAVAARAVRAATESGTPVPGAPARPPRASKLWGLLTGKGSSLNLAALGGGAGGAVTARSVSDATLNNKRGGSSLAVAVPANATALPPGVRVLTDCDVASLLGLTLTPRGEDDPCPIWFEPCVADDLNLARAEAWRAWPVARSLVVSAGSRSMRGSRSVGNFSDWSSAGAGASSGTETPRAVAAQALAGLRNASFVDTQLPPAPYGAGQPPRAPSPPNFARRSCLKAGGGTDSGTGGGSGSSDEGTSSSPQNKRVSFASEREASAAAAAAAAAAAQAAVTAAVVAPPTLRRSSSELVMLNSTPSLSWLGSMNGQSSFTDGEDGNGPMPIGGPGRAVSLPVGKPPRPGPQPFSSIGPDFSALLGSPHTRWQSSYTSTASVFTKGASARRRDRMRDALRGSQLFIVAE